MPERIFKLKELVELLDVKHGSFCHLEYWGDEVVIAVSNNEINYHHFNEAGLVPWMSFYNDKESKRITTRYKIPLEQIEEFRA